MALGYTYKAPLTASPLRHPSGRVYPLNASGVVTILAPDGADLSLGTQATLLCLTGTTADRPSSFQANTLRAGTAFYDTTLATFVVSSGGQTASGWSDQSGNSV